MGFSKRLLGLAKANLNALLERVVPDTPVGELTDEELEAELERRRARKRREEAERHAHDAARSSAHDAAKRRGTSPRAASSSGGGARRKDSGRASGAAQRPRPAPTPDARIRECYTLLELSPGAGFDAVKRAYRQLLRKYHPDLHVADARKHRAATELTMTITRAYQELEIHLGQRSAQGQTHSRR